MTIPRRADGWLKSSRSPDNANCVEVLLATTVGVRDTKARASGQLTVSATGWAAFITGLKTD